MKKIIKHLHLIAYILIFSAINILLYPVAAKAGKQNCSLNRKMLSPILHIHDPLLKQSFNLSKKQISAIPPASKEVETLSLEELEKTLIKLSLKNNFSLLKINWHKKHDNYQQFIKESAAVNDAIKHLISLKDITNIIDFDRLLDQAIKVRLDMIEHYQAPLSDKGQQAIFNIKKEPANIKILMALMAPPQEWFEPLFNYNRREAMLRACVKPLKETGIYNPSMDTPRIVATWGCSTQCDHCDGASIIQIESFPWIWIEQSQELTPHYISRINLASYHNDYFRDYYDFVFDKDASDIYKIFSKQMTSTSGFMPGSVGERALKKLLRSTKVGVFQVSFAPSAWMRETIQKYGVNQYISFLKNIQDIFQEAGAIRLLQYAVFDFRRVNDSQKIISQIVEFCKNFNQSSVVSKIHVNGRYLQLEKAREMEEFEINSEVYRFSSFSSDEKMDQEHFLFDDNKKYFLLPDGQLIRGIFPDTKKGLKTYAQIKGVGSIGQRKIRCFLCKSADCNGSLDRRCIGRKEYFNHLGLSPTGGFSRNFLCFESSI